MNQINRSTLIGIFLISCAILIVEITLTKIFSVTLWYHFSYFVISLAMFGMGFGGLLIYHLEEQFQYEKSKNLYLLSIALAISIILSLYAVLSYHLPDTFNWQSLLQFVCVYILCTSPFVLSSMILSVLFLNWPEKSNVIYSFDLQGAAIGCLGCVLLISYFTAPQVLLIASFICVVAAILFELPLLRIPSLIFLFGMLILIYIGNSLFQITQTKNYSELEYVKIFEKWSPLSRITVSPEIYFKGLQNVSPFGWGISSTYKQKHPFTQLWIQQDASAITPIVPFDGDFNKVDFLKYDITAIPYYLKKNPDVFVLGVGGGRDILTALAFNSHHITGVDIHPVIVDLLQNKFSGYVGHIYQNDKVHIEVSEGRTYLELKKKTYDIIQIPLIDSWAATVAGAFAMAENSIYTIEAFKTYLKYLKPNGILSVSRFYFKPDNQTIKIILLARAALEQSGITSPERNIVVVKNRGNNIDVATVLVQKEPFSLEQIHEIKKITHQFAFEIIYLPSDVHNEPLFQKALTSKNLNRFFQNYYYDIRPTTDDRPFFFQMLYFSKVKDLLTGKKITGQVFNYFGVAILFILLIISSILVLLFYFLPLLFSKTSKKPPLLWGLYFALLGLGFMLVEIPTLQLGSVYLGGPTYGLSVGLFCLLFFGGMGSILNNYSQKERMLQVLKRSLFFVVMLAIILPFYLHWLMWITFGYNWYFKLVLIILILIPIGFCMGVALPSGLRLARDLHRESIPWFWALNGAFSVLGSIIAMAISMTFGYSCTMVLASALYLFTWVLIKSGITK
ncbi:Predicted spermidine synthase with an N-terminal membrane domain [Legionella wadsworthii]|uniref:Predicted spermidine synthase with an N-terminal membrane domain n=1 Tax=Legionella wadsworthii TaxID=28088 RepID=A0A378LNP4_9GAMM|nr:class I SAM-dependent methyltransferase [Legionella wadsworthii]STY28010.1 Predicted spermidine synthase with an N-terminal membrane domain [Legionella wadsworthii]